MSLLSGVVYRKNIDNQLIEEINYIDGKRDGEHKQWYENGQLKYEYNYKDGKEDGLFTRWYENGQKSSEYGYKNDNFVG